LNKKLKTKYQKYGVSKMGNEQNKCPICSGNSIVNETSEGNIIKVECPRCGIYELTKDALLKYQKNDLGDKILSLSYWIRQHQSKDKPVAIDLTKMRSLLVPFETPKPLEQAQKLLLHLGNQAIKPSDSVDCSLTEVISIIGAIDTEDVKFNLDFLKRRGLVFVNNPSTNRQLVDENFKNFSASLSHEGWDRYYELQRSNKDSRLAFMAMQFNNDILQNIFNGVIIPSVKETGFEIRKLDDVKRAGLIDDKLRVEIRRSKFVLADLTDENRGAYWEAGFAEGLGIPVIYLCEEEKFEKEKPHFDTNHYLIVKWSKDTERWGEFADELKATIRETFPSEAKMEA
jgi:Zn ribbon nucleic-acid-binding protein